MFADFYRKHIAADAHVVYQGMHHSSNDPFADVVLDGDDNACVDFRYTASDRLSWWFDHHASAFQPAQLRQHFEADKSGQKFFDPTIKSCTKLIVDSVADRYGYELPAHMRDLVHWAHILDGAQFETAQDAIDLTPPHMQLATWLEHNKDEARTHELIRLLGERSMVQLSAEPWIREPLQPIMAQHQRNLDLVKQRATCAGGVVSFDLSADGVLTPNKFISYYLFPEARYTVALTRLDASVKISIGYNPWSRQPRAHNIAKLCERYGGGGHPVVGAITLPTDQLDRAHKAFSEICAELTGDGPKLFK